MEKLYLEILKKYSKVIFFFFIIILSFFFYNIKDFQLDASSDTLILDQDEDLKKYREVVNDYGTNDFLIVTFTAKNKILEKNNLSIIKSFIGTINGLPWVQNVQSIFDAPLLQINDQTLTDLTNEILTIDSPNISLIEAESELVNSPIFKNLIISEDGLSTGVLINIKRNERYDFLVRERARLNEINEKTYSDISNFDIINEEYEIIKKEFDNNRHQNITEIRKIIDRYDGNNLEIYLGGVSMIADDTITFVKKDIAIFGIGAILFILIVLFLVLKIQFGWLFVFQIALHL